jgi:hypothetical protein
LRKPGLPLQRGQYIGPDHLLQLRRRDLFVRSLIDPGLGRLVLTVLLEFLEQFSKAAIQQTANAGATQYSA